MRACNPRAFSLIEVTAVLVLLALLSTAAALSLRSACRGSQMDDVIGRITAFDQTARSLAVSKGIPGMIEVDPVGGRIRYKRPGEPIDELHPLILPAGYEFAAVDWVNEETHRDEAISCSTDGRTRSYRLTLTGPGGASRVLIFAGLTGQVTELEHDESLQADKSSSPRPDAH